MKKRMAARVGRTIDPAKVNDVASWLNYYKLKYSNIVQGEDGSLRVLDPAKLATDREDAFASAKVIPHMTGYDYIDILKTAEGTPELRASAEAKIEDIRSSIETERAALTATFLGIDRQLLEAVDAWKLADTVTGRKEAATLVGVLTHQLAEIEGRIRNAQYPKRYIKAESELPRKAIFYASHDDRKVPTVYRIVNEFTDVSDRVVSIGSIGEGTA
jgi:hypothetical protein